MKPIFQDLQNDILPSKCRHGKTQNQNESFNYMDSVSQYNDGNIATLNTLVTIQQLIAKRVEPVDNSLRKSGECYRSRRKYIRGMKKCKDDALKKKEGKTFESGQFTNK